MPKSKIEWTQHTWNPILGCSKKSPGCANCYAINQAYRNEAIAESLVSDGKNPGRLANYQGLTEKRGNRIEWTGKVVFVPEALLVPLKRKKPTMYFVNSMSDLFHESVKFEWIDQIFAVMAICSQHIFQILTKRPERMKKYFEYRDDTGSNKVHLIGTNTIIDLQSRLPSRISHKSLKKKKLLET